MLSILIVLTVDFVVMCRLSAVGVDFFSVRDKRKVGNVLPGVASLPHSLRRWLSNQWSVATSSRTRWSQPMAKAEAKGSGKGREAFSTTFFSIYVIISNDLACSITSNTKYIYIFIVIALFTCNIYTSDIYYNGVDTTSSSFIVLKTMWLSWSTRMGYIQ